MTSVFCRWSEACIHWRQQWFTAQGPALCSAINTIAPGNFQVKTHF